MHSAHTLTAVLQPLGLALDVIDASFTLDEANAPYAELTLTAALPEPADRALIDLRTTALTLAVSIRQDFGTPWAVATITTAPLYAGTVASLTALLGGQPLGSLTNRYYQPWNGSSVLSSRTRDAALTVKQRTFNDSTSTLTLTAVSGEDRLVSDALIAVTPWDPGSTSLKQISALVLERYGATLAPESLDATVTESPSTIWQPGVGAWEYLNPLFEAASLRLWCDELGVWRISERQSITPGAVTITPTNDLTELSDTMSLDPAVWYDAVVIEYRWTDALDLNAIAYDIAGETVPRSVLRVKRNTIFPGPGAALGVLNRGQGRGRVLNIAALSSYEVSPGISATITPPNTPALTGYVSAVTWRYPSNEMDVTTRGLIDTPATSWLFTPTGKRWTDIAGGVRWNNYTP
jgi:hypothetical protein